MQARVRESSSLNSPEMRHESLQKDYKLLMRTELLMSLSIPYMLYAANALPLPQAVIVSYHVMACCFFAYVLLVFVQSKVFPYRSISHFCEYQGTLPYEQLRICGIYAFVVISYLLYQKFYSTSFLGSQRQINTDSRYLFRLFAFKSWGLLICVLSRPFQQKIKIASAVDLVYKMTLKQMVSRMIHLGALTVLLTCQCKLFCHFTVYRWPIYAVMLLSLVHLVLQAVMIHLESKKEQRHTPHRLFHLMHRCCTWCIITEIAVLLLGLGMSLFVDCMYFL